jgi:hypothetical protein
MFRFAIKLLHFKMFSTFLSFQSIKIPKVDGPI